MHKNEIVSIKEVVKRLRKYGIKLLGKYINSKTKIRVRCFCGKIFSVRAEAIFSGHTTSCGCKRRLGGDKHHQWTGIGEINGSRIAAIKLIAKYRGLEYKLSKKYLWDLFLKQNRKCKLSGLDLYFESRSDRGDGTASLDRIDSGKGYIRGNIQWVHKIINVMKQDLSDFDFITLCGIIAKYNKNYIIKKQNKKKYHIRFDIKHIKNKRTKHDK